MSVLLLHDWLVRNLKGYLCGCVSSTLLCYLHGVFIYFSLCVTCNVHLVPGNWNCIFVIIPDRYVVNTCSCCCRRIIHRQTSVNQRQPRCNIVIRPISRDVRKTEIQFGFGFKNRTVQKIDICSDGFPAETA